MRAASEVIPEMTNDWINTPPSWIWTIFKSAKIIVRLSFKGQWKLMIYELAGYLGGVLGHSELVS